MASVLTPVQVPVQRLLPLTKHGACSCRQLALHLAIGQLGAWSCGRCLWPYAAADTCGPDPAEMHVGFVQRQMHVAPVMSLSTDLLPHVEEAVLCAESCWLLGSSTLPQWLQHDRTCKDAATSQQELCLLSQQGLCTAAALSPLEVSWSALRFRLDTEPPACAGLGTDSRELPSSDVLSSETACSRQIVRVLVQGTEELQTAAHGTDGAPKLTVWR